MVSFLATVLMVCMELRKNQSHRTITEKYIFLLSTVTKNGAWDFEKM